MNCPSCHREIKENFNICPFCGTALNHNQNQQGYQQGYTQYYQSAPENNQQYNQPNQGYNQQYNGGYNQQQNTGYNQPPYQQYGYTPYTQPQVDMPSTGFNVLSFFFPIIGFILYLVWNDKTPIKAKSVGKSALIGFIVNAVLSVFVFLFTFFAQMMFFYI